MKTRLWGIILAGLLAVNFHASADPDKVGITTEKRHTDGLQVHAAKKGKQKEAFDVHLRNQTLGDLAQLKVEYIIFIERPKLGQKLDQPPNVDRITGSQTIDLLTNREPKTFTTNEFMLETNTLRPGFAYADGGRNKSEDSVVGVWIRVVQDGQLIGEYTNPPTVTKRRWDLK